MKIEKINGNYTNTGIKKGHANFTGSPISVAEEITNALPAKNILKKMKNLEWLKGEIGGILLTAIGTGLVAPIFIGFNPFVKAPKDATKEQKEEVTNTKLYTAMRQPISAVLSILFQVSALKPIDKVLDKIFNNEEYAKNLSINVDQSALNSKSYLQSKVKKDLKARGITKPSLWEGFKEGFAKIKEERQNYDTMVKEAVEKKAEEQLAEVAETFRETGNIRVGKRNLDNRTVADLINKQIDEYIADATKLKIDNSGLAFYSRRAQTLVENENKLREMFKDIPVEEIDRTTDPNKLKQLYKKTDEILKAALVKEKDPEIQIVLQEILDRPEEIRASRIQRTLHRIDTIKASCKERFTPDEYLNAMSLRNSELDRTITKLKLNKIKSPEKATTQNIREAVQKMVENCQFKSSDALMTSILHDTNTFDSDTEKLTQKIYKDITKLYKKFVENNYKAPNQIIKILIGVCITLPITCNALNWVYPRFMEAVFPGLAGVKKDGGDK